MGDWGLGIGDCAQSPIPNPQSPIPNPQLYKKFDEYIDKIKINLKLTFEKFKEINQNEIQICKILLWVYKKSYDEKALGIEIAKDIFNIINFNNIEYNEPLKITFQDIDIFISYLKKNTSYFLTETEGNDIEKNEIIIKNEKKIENEENKIKKEIKEEINENENLMDIIELSERYKNMTKSYHVLKDNVTLTKAKYEYIQSKSQHYYGEFNKENNLKHGRGVFKVGNKIYEGYFKNGWADGKGVLYTENSTFKGIFEKGNKKRGEEIFKNNTKFNGEYENDCFKNGTIIYPSKNIYIGELKNNLKNGKGKYIIYRRNKGKKKSEVFEGMWKDDLRNGKGIFTFQNGDTLDGIWINGNFSEGIFYSKDGETQQFKKNEFKNDQYNVNDDNNYDLNGKSEEKDENDEKEESEKDESCEEENEENNDEQNIENEKIKKEYELINYEEKKE